MYWLSEQNYGGTTYFIPENQKQTHVVYPPYMAYPGVPTDTSVAFMERTTQMKVNARTSFFVGEGMDIWMNDFFVWTRFYVCDFFSIHKQNIVNTLTTV